MADDLPPLEDIFKCVDYGKTETTEIAICFDGELYPWQKEMLEEIEQVLKERDEKISLVQRIPKQKQKELILLGSACGKATNALLESIIQIEKLERRYMVAPAKQTRIDRPHYRTLEKKNKKSRYK